MKTRTELKQAYKQTPRPMGVFMIKNNANGKIYLASSPNLEGAFNKEHFQLKMGAHRNAELTKEWKTYGEEAFTFEVLEELKVPEEGYFDQKYELKTLEAKWLEQLQPYGEKGYHKPKA